MNIIKRFQTLIYIIIAVIILVTIGGVSLIILDVISINVVDAINFIYVLFSVTMSLFILSISLAIFRFMLKIPTWSIFGSRPYIRAFALGISAIIFNSAVSEVIRSSINLAGSILDDIPSIMQNGWGQATATCLNQFEDVDSYCVTHTVFIILDTLYESLEFMLSRSSIKAWDFIGIISFLILAIFLGKALSALLGIDSQEKDIIEKLAASAIRAIDLSINTIQSIIEKHVPEDETSSTSDALILDFEQQKDILTEQQKELQNLLNKDSSINSIFARIFKGTTSESTNATRPEPTTDNDISDNNPLAALLVRFLTQPGLSKNILFFVLLAFGSYLSIASVIAIPILQDNMVEVSEIPDINTDNLEEHLSNNILAIPEVSFEQSPFASLDSYISEQESRLSELEENPDDSADEDGVRESIENSIRSTKLLKNSEERRRSILISSYDELINQARSEANQSQTRAVEKFRLNSQGRLGTRENTAFYLEIQDWHISQIQSIETEISECSSLMEYSNDVWIQWSDDLVQWLEEDISIQPPEVSSSIYRQVLTACDGGIETIPMPQRLPLGSFTGLFGQATSWILETESLNLAIIVGLFGFGFIGSLSSTFIREQAANNTNPQEGIIIDDIIGVVLRGTTAAVVVYLAGQGGLAIFAETGSRPNPHALLLICLVGAVFSEMIWEWARKQLQEYIHSNNVNTVNNTNSAYIPLDEVIDATDAADDDTNTHIPG